MCINHLKKNYYNIFKITHVLYHQRAVKLQTFHTYTEYICRGSFSLKSLSQSSKYMMAYALTFAGHFKPFTHVRFLNIANMYMYPYCMDYCIARYRISIYEQYEKEN